MSQPFSIRDSDLVLAKEFARRLTAVVDKRILQVTLYGSRARGMRARNPIWTCLSW